MKTIRTIGFISILGGVLVHLAVLTVIGIRSPLQRTPFRPRVQVEYVGNLDARTAPAILQQASLMDSAPLFMPTRWNPASQMAEVASLREATEIFEPFAARVSLPEARPTLPVDRTAVTPLPESSLPDDPAFYMARFDRVRSVLPAVRSPGPSLRIQVLAGGAAGVDGSQALPQPLATLAPPAMWGPVHFFLQVADGIPVGLPVLSQSSGFAEWDEVLQGFIGSLDFYRNLDDGYYRLAAYP